jgi:hypothetical protein
MKHEARRTRENTAFPEMMRRIGLVPESELPPIEQRALQYAKEAVNWAACVERDRRKREARR